MKEREDSIYRKIIWVDDTFTSHMATHKSIPWHDNILKTSADKSRRNKFDLQTALVFPGSYEHPVIVTKAFSVT